MIDPLRGLRREAIERIEDVLPYLTYRGGSLRVAGHEAVALFVDDALPQIIYVAERMRENARAARTAFERNFPAPKTYFAMKCCYFRDCLDRIRAEGLGVEVMSHFELELALQAGFEAADIVATGAGRTAAYLQRTAEIGVAVDYVDSIEELRRLSAVAEALGQTVRVGLRVILPLGRDVFVPPSAKIGIDRGSPFDAALIEALALPHVGPCALLMHHLSHCGDLDTYRLVMREAASFALEMLERFDHPFEIIDIGGGFDTRFLLTANGIDIQDFADVAAEELGRIPYPFRLQVQPGRFIAADAAVGFTNVASEKRNTGRLWKIIEMGSNVLIPLPEIAYHPIPLVLAEPGTPWQECDIGDGTGAPSALCRAAELPGGPAGRQLALLNVGAYTTVFSELWAFPIPWIGLIDEAGELQELFGYGQQADMMRAYYGYDLELPRQLRCEVLESS